MFALRPLSRIVTLVLFAALISCADGSGSPTESGPPIETVDVSPPTKSLVAGQTVALTATPRDPRGRPLNDRAIVWSSESPNVATVSQQGVVTAIAVGSSIITATSEGKQGQATIEVSAQPPDPVASVEIDATSLELLKGTTRQLVAIAKGANGEPLDGRTITWVSQSAAIAEVSAQGLVTAMGAGTTTIAATTEGKSASVQVTVTLPPPAAVATVQLDATSFQLDEGDSRKLVAVAKDAQGQVLDGRVIVWSSSEALVAEVSGQGNVSALRGGSANITATVEGKSATATLAVRGPGADLAFDSPTWQPQNMPELYTLGLQDANGLPNRILLAGSARDIAVSPNGQRIAFVATDDGNANIYVANRDGSNVHRLTSRPYNEDQPAWSPDGTRIAFRRWLDSGTIPDVWVMNADGTGEVNLTNDPNFTGAEHSPAWSPVPVNGSHRIAFVREVRGGDGYLRARVYSMKDDGSEKNPVTITSDSYDDEPAWSPDGQSIVFQRTGPAHTHQLLVVALSTGNVRALFANDPDGFQYAPAWSPDGALIAFVSSHEIDGDGTYEKQIYTVRPDGTLLTRRTWSNVDKERPSWMKR